MPRRPAKRADPAIVELLKSWLAYAKRGDVTDVLILGRLPGGEYVDDWLVRDDIGDMACELRSTVIRMQTQADEPEPAIN